MRSLTMLVLAVLLSACADVASGVQTVKDLADKAAKIEVQLPCAMTVGSYYRALDDKQKAGVTLLCDPDAIVIILPRPR